MQRVCSHKKKISRCLLYIAATNQIEFIDVFDKFVSSLPHIIVPGNIQHLVRYLTNEFEGQLREIHSDTL